MKRSRISVQHVDVASLLRKLGGPRKRDILTGILGSIFEWARQQSVGRIEVGMLVKW